MDKRIKTPMIIGIVLQGLALLIAFICYLLQGSMGSMLAVNPGEKVFPESIITITIVLMIHIVALLVMQTYEGESRRLTAGLLVAAYCVVNVASPIVSRITAVFASRKGAEFVAAKSVLASVISMFSSPLTCISLVLVLLALGRYGVLDKQQS